MTYPVLARASEALTDDETVALLRDRLAPGVVDHVAEFGDLTVVVTAAAWHDAAATCRDESLLSFDMFDCLFGIDAGDEGFDVVAVLYSTSKGRRIMLRARCDGTREAPTLPSITDLYRGADWMEREAFDMFGIDFEGHPGLLPRILSVENFEGWPLRKDFALSSRVAKPWPGVKEPAETDEDGNVIVREPGIGEAAGPSGLDEVIAKQAREANASPEDEAAVGEGEQPDEDQQEPAREEVDIDQETFDRLVAEGKSERIARSKAKAAFIKKQRAAAKAGAPATPPSGDAADGEQSPSEAQASPPVDDDAAAAASAKADTAREQQARAREERAAAQADQPDPDADDLPGVPEGTPPPDDAAPDEPGGDEADEDGEEQR